MNIRKIYINSIKSNCASPAIAEKSLSYWRNNLFAGIIIFILPFSFIALVPGLYWSLYTQKYIIAQIDITVILSFLIVAFAKGIPIPIRKIILIASVYLLSCVMLYNTGLQGSGRLYLLIACVLSNLIFPTKYSLQPAILNTLICILIGIGVYYKLLPWQNDLHNSTGAWIAAASSVVFLSFLLSVLIPKLFNGLEKTLYNEKNLAIQLNVEQKALNHTMIMLEKKNKELEQFTYAASHDLQEPLRMVTGFLGMLEKKYKNIIDAKGQQYIWYAVDGAKRMQLLIKNLLDFSHIGSKQVVLEDIQLPLLIKEICQLYTTEIESKQAEIIIEELPKIHANRVALNQVFQNLIGNSLKYCQKDKKLIIEIAAQDKETHWQFSVNDNGIGIAANNFKKVFVLFQRLHSKEEYPGTGIGLAITKKNIEQMGGDIWLESEEGEGTTFYFTIPKQPI